MKTSPQGIESNEGDEADDVAIHEAEAEHLD